MKRHPITILMLWLTFDIVVGYIYAILPETMHTARLALSVAQLVGLLATGGYSFVWMVRSF